MRTPKRPDLNRSCTWNLQYDRGRIAHIAELMIIQDGMDERFPEVFVRIACYPMGFRASWAHGQDLGILHMYDVAPILEKEPLTLEDSRLWC